MGIEWPRGESPVREVVGGMDLNGCSRKRTDQPLAGVSKLGPDSILQSLLHLQSLKYLLCVPLKESLLAPGLKRKSRWSV